MSLTGSGTRSERAAPAGRILALQLKRLGDLVLARPALHLLRQRHPGARLVLVTEAPFHEVLAGDTAVDEIRLHPRGTLASLGFGRALAGERFDLAIDFQGSATSARLAWQSGAPVRIGWRLRGRRLLYTTSVPRPPGRPPRHTADQKLDLVRAASVAAPDDASPASGPADLPGPLPLLHGEREEARRTLAAAGIDPGRPFLVAAPASRREYKRWPAPRFGELLAGFRAETGAPILLVGGPGERGQLAAVADRLDTAPPLLEAGSVRALMSLLAEAAAFVGPDGGARQMAEALGTPTLALFGPQSPEHWTRLSPRHRAVAARRVDCRIRCSKGKVPCDCLARVPVESVLAELRELWRAATREPS